MVGRERWARRNRFLSRTTNSVNCSGLQKLPNTWNNTWYHSNEYPLTERELLLVVDENSIMWENWNSQKQETTIAQIYFKNRGYMGLWVENRRLVSSTLLASSIMKREGSRYVDHFVGGDCKQSTVITYSRVLLVVYAPFLLGNVKRLQSLMTKGRQKPETLTRNLDTKCLGTNTTTMQ